VFIHIRFSLIPNFKVHVAIVQLAVTAKESSHVDRILPEAQHLAAFLALYSILDRSKRPHHSLSCTSWYSPKFRLLASVCNYVMNFQHEKLGEIILEFSNIWKSLGQFLNSYSANKGNFCRGGRRIRNLKSRVLDASYSMSAFLSRQTAFTAGFFSKLITTKLYLLIW
jgi:hypothetical protein